MGGHDGRMRIRPEGVLAGLVAVALIAAGAAVFVAANRDVPEFDTDSPDVVALTYVDAVLNDDETTAEALLSERVPCDVSDGAVSYHPDSARVVVDDVVVDGDEAVVVLDVTEIEGNGPFASSEYTHAERLQLRLEQGAWRILQAPWPPSACADGDKR